MWALVVVPAISTSVCGYVLQLRRIRKQNSANAISLAWLIGLSAGSLAAFLYALSKHDSWLAINAAANMVMQLILIAQVWGHKAVSRRDKIFTVILFVELLTLMAVIGLIDGKWHLIIPVLKMTIEVKDVVLLSVGFTAWLAQDEELHLADQRTDFHNAMPLSQVAACVGLAVYAQAFDRFGLFVGFVSHAIGQLELVRQNHKAQNK